MQQEDQTGLDTKICRSCAQTKNISLFVKNKVCKNGIDSICLACSRERVKAWRKAGKRNHKEERLRALSRNPDKIKAREKAAQKKYYDAHKRKPRVLKTKLEILANRQKNESKRRAGMRIFWEQELTDFVAKEAHHLRKLRDKATNFKWHVDHIIPLKGASVCGLNVWNNLQVIPAKENLRKGNSYDGIGNSRIK